MDRIPFAEERVTTLELFFDLVFVFTVTQVALILEHDASWPAVAQMLLELMAIYWLYGGFAWLTNTIGARTNRQRIVLLLGMAAFLLVSLAVPRAFDVDAVAFGWAYLALALVHLTGFLIGDVPAAAHAILRIAPFNVGAAVLVLIAGYAGGSSHWWLFTAAVLLVWLSPLAGRSLGSFSLNPRQFGERHGLMIIIVLGESLVSVATAAQELSVSVSLALGVLSGLAASAAMWWCYFVDDDDLAAEALGRRPEHLRGVTALFGYDLTHVLMMAGVIGIAAGSRLSLPDLAEPTSVSASWLIAGGAATYLVSLAGFRAVLGFAIAGPRGVAALAALATAPVGIHLGAAQQLAFIAALVTAMLVAEHALPDGSERTAAPATHRDPAG